MKKYRRPIVIFLVILAGYYLLEPGNRYLLMKYNSGNEYGQFYYHNGLWPQRIRLGSDFQRGLSTADLSPDGKQIVFENNGIIYTYRLPMGQITPISSESFNAYYVNKIQWSPDGSQIGFVCSLKLDTAEICVFDVASQQLHILTDYHTQKNYTVPYFGSWGSNNDSIVYVLRTNPSADGETLDSIKIIHTKSGQIDTVLDEAKTNLAAFGWEPVLSPDGKTILFSGAILDWTYGKSEIYQVNVNGSNLHQVAEMDGFYLANPVWSPDGQSFYVHSSDGNYFKPIHFNLDGKRLIGIPFQYQRTLLSWKMVK